VRARHAESLAQRPGGSRKRSAAALAIAWLTILLIACAHAHAAIYFRSGATAQTGSGATSIAVNVPAGVVAGDVMIASIAAEGGGNFTAPSGWSSTNLFAGATKFGTEGVYFHVAGSSEPTSYSWGMGSTPRKATGKIASYVGVENGSPIEVKAGTAGNSSGTSDNAASITTTVNNTMVILDFSAANSAGSFTITPPGSTTMRASVFTSGTGSVVGSQTQDFIQATAGATGTKTFTTSASIPWEAITIALKPGTGALGFDVAPSIPALPAVTLNGQAQTTNATMNNFAVDDTTSGTGWNVTVAGNTSAGKSPAFKQYCSNGTEACGSHPANSYVTGGQTLPAGSLQLNTAGASWSTTGGSGTAPAFQCNSTTCPIDASSATKIASTASGAGLGPWKTSGFGATSLALSTPTTLRVLPEHEVYRADLLWTLSSGP
jgi:hypothetical protein